MRCGTRQGLDTHKSRNEYPCKFCIRFRDNPTPAPAAPTPTKVKCGTVNGYAKHVRDGTERCPPCREAKNKYQRETYGKGQRSRVTTKEIKHGTVWGYRQHVARGEKACDPCRTKATEKRKEDRERKR